MPKLLQDKQLSINNTNECEGKGEGGHLHSHEELEANLGGVVVSLGGWGRTIISHCVFASFSMVNKTYAIWWWSLLDLSISAILRYPGLSWVINYLLGPTGCFPQSFVNVSLGIEERGSVKCAVCSVQFAVCSVQCAVCSVQCAVCPEDSWVSGWLDIA